MNRIWKVKTSHIYFSLSAKKHAQIRPLQTGLLWYLLFSNHIDVCKILISLPAITIDYFNECNNIWEWILYHCTFGWLFRKLFFTTRVWCKKNVKIFFTIRNSRFLFKTRYFYVQIRIFNIIWDLKNQFLFVE